MPDIESMIKTQRVLCIKKFLETSSAGWKFFLESYLKKVGGKFLFQCHFDFTKLPIALPDFYKECISTWSSLNEDNPSSLSDIVNQVLWNNRFICIDSRSVYSKKLFDAGLIKIGNLYDENGELKLDKEPWRSSLSQVDRFLIFRLLNAFPQEWRREFKLNRTSIYRNTQYQNLSSIPN